MAYNRITWVPDALRAVGITVVEHDGWKTRGLSTTRPFTPRTLVWHHDASAKGDSPGVPAYMIRNYNTAGAQLWVDRQGRWHIIASGRAAHAGATLAGMPTNETSIGIETDHTTGEDWPPALLASLRKGSAALLNHLGVSASNGLHFHKTICDPPGRKVDPDGLSLSKERGIVASLSADLKAASKSAAPVPTMLDLTIALERFAEQSGNPRAVVSYTLARRILGSLVGSSARSTVPVTVRGVVNALEARKAAATGVTKVRLASAITLLRPLQ